MFAKKYRISKSDEIKRVLRRGAYRHLNSMLVVTWLTNTLNHPRVTIIVSQKVSKKAVVRNRIRRALIGSIEKGITQEWSSPYDVVIVVKRVTEETIKQAKQLLVNFLQTIMSVRHAKSSTKH